jgi:hypothetical protein
MPSRRRRGQRHAQGSGRAEALCLRAEARPHRQGRAVASSRVVASRHGWRSAVAGPALRPEDRDPETGHEAGLVPRAAGRDRAMFLAEGHRLVEGRRHRAGRLDPATSLFQEGRRHRAARLGRETFLFQAVLRLLEGRLGRATFPFQAVRRLVEGRRHRAVRLGRATLLLAVRLGEARRHRARVTSRVGRSAASWCVQLWGSGRCLPAWSAARSASEQARRATRQRAPCARGAPRVSLQLW